MHCLGANLDAQPPMDWSPKDPVEYCAPVLSPPVAPRPGLARGAPHHLRYLRRLQGRRVGRVVGGGAGPRVEVPVVAATVII